MKDKYIALYKRIMDDLKDSDMMIDYAYAIKRENSEDKFIADDLAKYAQYRLNHSLEFHKIFQNEVMKKKEENLAESCHWKLIHSDLMDWHSKIEQKIKKYF